MISNFDVERVYKNADFSTIIERQKENKHSKYHEWLWNNFKHHEDWLEKAYRGLVAGEKIAFSAKLRSEKSKYLGSAILKKEDFYDSKVAEVKNLVVDVIEIQNELLSEYCENKEYNSETKDLTDDDRESVSKEVDKAVKKIWTKLISKVEGFCRRRGFKKITFEVAAEELTLINFFLGRQFRISEAKKSNYHSGCFLYSLSKDLPTSYTGDPFSLEEMGKWLIAELLGFEFIENDYQNIEDETHGYEDDDLEDLLTLIRFRRFSFSNRLKSIGRDIVEPSEFLTGKIIIIDDWFLDYDFQRLNEEILKKFVRSDNFHIILTYYEQSDLHDKCDKVGIKYFSRESNKNIFGKDSSIQAIDFSRDDIGGLTLVVGNDFINSTDEIDKDYYIFYINGSNGACITEPNSKDMLILYYSPMISSLEGKGGIWGYSRLIGHGYSRQAKNPGDHFKKFDFFDFFDKDKENCPKYKKLIKYNEDGPVISLLLTRPNRLAMNKFCIPLENIFGNENVALKKLASDQMIFSDFYIDNQMRDLFLEAVLETHATQDASDSPVNGTGTKIVNLNAEYADLKLIATELFEKSKTSSGFKLYLNIKVEPGGNLTYVANNGGTIVKIGKVENQPNSKVIFAEKIDNLTYNEKLGISNEDFILLKEALTSLPSENIDRLKSHYDEVGLAQNDTDKTYKLENLKNFLVSSGISIAQGVSASAIFEMLKMITFS